MDELIRDLLDYSRLSRAEVQISSVSLDKIADDVLKQLATDIKKKRAAIEVKRPLGWVLGHRSILTQALSNLLANALKFVAPGTAPHVAIWVTHLEDRRRLRLWVEDRGIGIAPEHQARVSWCSSAYIALPNIPGQALALQWSAKEWRGSAVP